MPEIRFTITDGLDKILRKISENYGVDKSDYVRSLILNDLKNQKEVIKNDRKKNIK